MKLTRSKKQKWLKNTGIFLAPVVVIYLVFTQTNLQDGFDWNDFAPTKEVVGAMCLYVVNVGMDYLRKVKK